MEPRADRALDPQATIWTVIRGAAAGDARQSAEFAERYLTLARRYLAERWRGSPMTEALEDACQEVFLECFRADGVLEKADPDRPGGFRAFLFGAIRNVARRHEAARLARSRPKTETHMPLDLEAREHSVEQVLDREWARCLMQEAAEHHRRTALALGAAARQGIELLRLRFEEGLAIREIAARWEEDPALVHRRYRQARARFHRSLRRVVGFHCPESADLEAECQRLLGLLGGE